MENMYLFVFSGRDSHRVPVGVSRENIYIFIFIGPCIFLFFSQISLLFSHKPISETLDYFYKQVSIGERKIKLQLNISISSWRYPVG